MKLLDDMLSIGLKPDVVIFNTLLDGMLSIGLKPDVATCKTLIDSYCEDGRIEDVLTLFREMLSKAAKTDTVTENIISWVLFQIGRTGIKMELNLKMTKGGKQVLNLK